MGAGGKVMAGCNKGSKGELLRKQYDTQFTQTLQLDNKGGSTRNSVLISARNMRSRSPSGILELVILLHMQVGDKARGIVDLQHLGVYCFGMLAIAAFKESFCQRRNASASI